MAFKKSNTKKEELKYEIFEDLGTFGESKGYDKKLTYTSWNGNEPKYEFRSWKQEDGTPGRGIHSFTGEEMEKILELLKKIEDEEI